MQGADTTSRAGKTKGIIKPTSLANVAEMQTFGKWLSFGQWWHLSAEGGGAPDGAEVSEESP